MRTTVFWVKVALALAVAATGWIYLLRGISSHPEYRSVERDLICERCMLELDDLLGKHPSNKPIRSPRMDPWGTPYRHTKQSRPGADGSAIFVYSPGEDARSDSGGHDPDDINSESEHHRAHYESPFLPEAIGGFLMALALWFITSIPVFGMLHGIHMLLLPRPPFPPSRLFPQFEDPSDFVVPNPFPICSSQRRAREGERQD